MQQTPSTTSDDHFVLRAIEHGVVSVYNWIEARLIPKTVQSLASMLRGYCLCCTGKRGTHHGICCRHGLDVQRPLSFFQDSERSFLTHLRPRSGLCGIYRMPWVGKMQVEWPQTVVSRWNPSLRVAGIELPFTSFSHFVAIRVISVPARGCSLLEAHVGERTGVNEPFDPASLLLGMVSGDHPL